MDINPRLFVEIHPMEASPGGRVPRPHPVEDAGFDPRYVYKVLGMYNPSETSECYFVLANPERQIWFIPQRHLLAYKLMDSDEFFLPLAAAPGEARSFASKRYDPLWARPTAGRDAPPGEASGG